LDSASNRNEYQKYFLGGKGSRCVRLTLPHSFADCYKIREPQPPVTLRTCIVVAVHYSCFTLPTMQYFCNVTDSQFHTSVAAKSRSSFVPQLHPVLPFTNADNCPTIYCQLMHLLAECKIHEYLDPSGSSCFPKCRIISYKI